MTVSKSGLHSLHFIDELIIPENILIDGYEVGGLSAIDYFQNTWYVLSDDRKSPRFYIMELPYSLEGFGNYTVRETRFFKDLDGATFESGKADPEGLRINSKGQILWASEGDARKMISPFIRKASQNGVYIDSVTLPSRYKLDKNGIKGPRNNGVFEAISLNYNSDDLWVATELPLLQDGSPPTSKKGGAPVRISFIDNRTKTFGKEYVYTLDKVARSGPLEVNGITEILSYAQDKLLVLERSYASDYKDGGNDIKIYKVSSNDATDVKHFESLKSATYTALTKTLLLDLSTIRSKTKSGIIDNVEGMAFGPLLENGNPSLILISDNNFNSFGKQVSQVLLFEIK
ncbi:esterase-like activity of phytase family protein [Dokdonia sp. Hel_I_53]|uniref:esterase-like activity of phytase family protein n=1 Tax=Dokdonia sp. Hel_I_53 TaxID=1566287 RepID=UPI0016481A92|nr:esterase-like activity of phytase family protein [Dokdonia sp. Hel_I_53]